MPRVHLVQMDIAWEAPTANHARARSLIAAARVSAGDLVLLPEMFDTGFSFNTSVTADTHEHTLSFIKSLATDFGVVVQAGRTRPAATGTTPAFHNVVSIFAPSAATPLCEYAKRHLIGREGEYIAPGRDIVTYPWAGLTIAPAICYDLRFPEVFRDGLKKGAEAFAVCACWPNVRKEHWRALLIARAIENQAFVFACNRVGRDPDSAGGLTYDGGSMVIGPKGEILAEASTAECVLGAEVEIERVRAWRGVFPAWREVR